MDYQVIIVGAGPAGIFSALTLANQGITPILLLELGKDLSERKRRNSNDMLCGWGGAGAYSDGKLTLSPEVGGLLGEYLEPEALHQILQAADEVAETAGDRGFAARSLIGVPSPDGAERRLRPVASPAPDRRKRPGCGVPEEIGSSPTHCRMEAGGEVVAPSADRGSPPRGGVEAATSNRRRAARGIVGDASRDHRPVTTSGDAVEPAPTDEVVV